MLTDIIFGPPPSETLAKIRTLPQWTDAVHGHLSKVYEFVAVGEHGMARAYLPNIENWIDEGFVRFSQKLPVSEVSQAVWPLRQRIQFLRTSMVPLRRSALQDVGEATLDEAYQLLVMSGYLSGIRTAAARKKSKPPREIIRTIIVRDLARRVVREFPQIRRLHLVGSRLRHRYARDVEFVAVVDDERNMPSRNIVNALDGPVKVDLFFSLPDEVEPHILEFGLGFDIMRWKRAAIAKGYKLTRYGLWKGNARVSNRMAEIAVLIGMPLKPNLVWSLENPLF